MLGDWFDFLRPVQTIWTPLQPSVIARTESKLCVSPQLKRYMHPHCCSDVASCGENQTAKDWALAASISQADHDSRVVGVWVRDAAQVALFGLEISILVSQPSEPCGGGNGRGGRILLALDMLYRFRQSVCDWPNTPRPRHALPIPPICLRLRAHRRQANSPGAVDRSAT